MDLPLLWGGIFRVTSRVITVVGIRLEDGEEEEEQLQATWQTNDGRPAWNTGTSAVELLRPASNLIQKEMHTMKWLGATNLFVKAPFIIEGLLLGLIGTVIPLLILYFFYKEIIVIINERFSILSNVLKFLSVKQVFQILLPVSLLLGEGIGFIGSFFTIRRHLKV